jgi:hypothetical protein
MRTVTWRANLGPISLTVLPFRFFAGPAGGKTVESSSFSIGRRFIDCTFFLDSDQGGVSAQVNSAPNAHGGSSIQRAVRFFALYDRIARMLLRLRDLYGDRRSGAFIQNQNLLEKTRTAVADSCTWHSERLQSLPGRPAVG